MKTLIAFVFLIVSSFSFAQTDIIEMRSRNASLKKYTKATISSEHDHIVSNFGMRRDVTVRNAVLDSVKCVSDSVAIMYTSYYCTDNLPEPPVQFHYDDEGKPYRTFSNPRVGTKWEPGELTVRNHPLFRHKHSLDSIKRSLDRDYYFKLPSDSIKFIGFDNNTQGESNVDSVQPVKHKRQKKNSLGWELIFMIVTPILFMIAMSRMVLSPNSNPN